MRGALVFRAAMLADPLRGRWHTQQSTPAVNCATLRRMSLITILVALVVCCLVYWAATKLMAAFGVPDPIRTVVIVVLVVLLVVWLLGLLGYPILRLRL